MTVVLVIGAGGHARVCLEALADSGHEVVGCVSRDGTGVDGLGVPVLGTDADVAAVAASHGATAVFVAVGDNRAREALQERAAAAGLPAVNAVSRFAMVSSSATLGSGVLVAAGAVINAAARVGDGAILNTRCSIDHDGVVAPYAHVSVGVATGGAATIGRRALVGLGSSILPGVVVGDDAVVGAGAVVVADVPAAVTVVGVPARERS